jgi:hypothetical protein
MINQTQIPYCATPISVLFVFLDCFWAFLKGRRRSFCRGVFQVFRRLATVSLATQYQDSSEHALPLSADSSLPKYLFLKVI